MNIINFPNCKYSVIFGLYTMALLALIPCPLPPRPTYHGQRALFCVKCHEIHLAATSSCLVDNCYKAILS